MLLAGGTHLGHGSPLTLRRAIGSSASTTQHCMVDQQQNDRSDDRHEHTVDVEAGDPFSPDEAKQKAADDCPDNPQNDIEDHPLRPSC
jgi:hypothetical protein